MKQPKLISTTLALLFLMHLSACDNGSSQKQSENTPADTSAAENNKTSNNSKPSEHIDTREANDQEKIESHKVLSAREIYSRFSDSVVVVENYNHLDELVSRGTGFFISQDGLLVTNLHVIDGASNLAVRIKDGATVQVTDMVAACKSSDIAILKVAGNGYPWISTNSHDLSVGDDVYVIGNPLGFLEKTLSTGVVSAFREFSGEESSAGIEMIQITAATSSGSSGSPLMNRFGQLVGVIVGGYEGGENLNMASSSANVLSLLNSEPDPQPIEDFYRLQDIRNLKLFNVPEGSESKIYIEINKFSGGDAPELAAMVKQRIISDLSKDPRMSATFLDDMKEADIVITVAVSQHEGDGIYCLAELEAIQNLQLERAFDVLIEDPDLREIAKINSRKIIDGFTLSRIQKKCKSPDELSMMISDFLTPVRWHEGIRLPQLEKIKTESTINNNR